MAARRLLIVMLVLLGLSTLAAALIPQRSLNGGGSASTTAPTTTSTTTSALPVHFPPTKITVGGKKFPVVSPVYVGDQLTLLVRSRQPAQISIPEFGQLGFASPDSPAYFELLPKTPGTFGILFASTGEVAAQIRVVPTPKKRPKAKGRARAGRGRA